MSHDDFCSVDRTVERIKKAVECKEEVTLHVGLTLEHIEDIPTWLKEVREKISPVELLLTGNELKLWS